MKKLIIATTLSGLFIKSDPWKKAHILWFEKVAEKLQDSSVRGWANRQDYFNGVDIVMRRLYPDLSEEKRTIKAREAYFDSVCEYIKENPQILNKEIIDYFLSLKDKYKIMLVTTNTKDKIGRILSITNLANLFDAIEASNPEEKDDKGIVFDRFLKKYGKPVLYLGTDRKESFDYCKKNKIHCIFVNIENMQEVKGVDAVHNFGELKEKIENL